MIRSGRSRTERRCPHCRTYVDVRAWARHVAACAKTEAEREDERYMKALERKVSR